MKTRKSENTENTENTENMETNKVQEISNNKIKIFLYNFANQLSIFLKLSFDYGIKFIKIFINISGIYIAWIFLHYISSHLYVRLCVPRTIVGFLLSPFMTVTPHCQGLRWIIVNGANMINNMWIILGTWLMTNVFIVMRDANTS